MPASILQTDPETTEVKFKVHSNEVGFMETLCYLYVAGGLALAWQVMTILASGASSG